MKTDQVSIFDQHTTIKDITPELAREYLQRGNGNAGRYKTPFIERVVNNYAQEMKNGNWVLSHQGIAFDEDNILVDGYNRLNAIIKSGMTVRMSVTWNIPREAIKYLDSGKLRNNSDKLRVPKRFAQCLRFAAHITYNNIVPSVSEMEIIKNSKFGDILELLISYSPNTSKSITCSSVICGVAFCALSYDYEYAISQFRHVYMRNYRELTPIVEMFSKQIDRNLINATNKTDALARSIWVFNPENKLKTQTGRLNETLARTLFKELLTNAIPR